MTSFVTSYVGLFSSPETAGPSFERIEIPLIQRDYAQGRRDERASDVRDRFLEVLHHAVTEPGNEIGLDFIYGDIDDGALRPLDGQQRLTTLFLLHWYVGWRAGQLGEHQPWMNFSYATRPTARLFCERLVLASPPVDEQDPASWIEDQPWYLYVWRNDPTIQAMLVMIRAIHIRFNDCEPLLAWERLTSSDSPAITFQLLPIDDMGSGEDLYIKMNSRGKPLTPFENFKARFESAISWVGDKATEFDRRVDGDWCDILWRLRGPDDLVDEQFMHYLEFITDISQWRNKQLPGTTRLEARALEVFGVESDHARESLDFLFHAFDTWKGCDISDEFSRLFTTNRADLMSNPDRLLLFGAEYGTDLFDACCRHYGTGRFTYARTLLLLAVLINRRSPSEEFSRRLRVVRNLIEASESELRPQRLPALVADVHRIVAEGSLDELTGFNRAQIDDERAKHAFLDAHPELATSLFRLEDHALLHGSLQAFTLDAATFADRATAFETLMAKPDLWRGLTGALLASGLYAKRRNPRDLQFGSPANAEPWRTLLTGSSRTNLQATAETLGRVLDAVAAGKDAKESLREVRETFVRRRQLDKHFDWRYYLVRYDVMRIGSSGIYASVGGNMGYLVCMLEKTQMNGRYRDPYLTALAQQAGPDGGLAYGMSGPVYTGGHIDYSRWMYMSRSGTGIKCVSDGWELKRPDHDAYQEPFDAVCAAFSVGPSLKLVIPQATHEGHRADSADRVKAGAALLKALAASSL